MGYPLFFVEMYLFDKIVESFSKYYVKVLRYLT